MSIRPGLPSSRSSGACGRSHPSRLAGRPPVARAAVLHVLYIAFIAAIYIGFAVADGRTKIIAVESTVAIAFLVLAAAGVTGSAWLLVVRLRGPWRQGLLAAPNQFVAGTRWWPPFCATVDCVVAAILADRDRLRNVLPLTEPSGSDSPS